MQFSSMPSISGENIAAVERLEASNALRSFSVEAAMIFCLGSMPTCIILRTAER